MFQVVSRIKCIFICVCIIFLSHPSLASSNIAKPLPAKVGPASTQPLIPNKPNKPVKPVKPIKPDNWHHNNGVTIIETQTPDICHDVEYSGRWRKEQLCMTESEWSTFKSEKHCHSQNGIVHCKK